MIFLLISLTVLSLLAFYLLYKSRRKLFRAEEILKEALGDLPFEQLLAEVKKTRNRRTSLSKELDIYTSLLEELPVGVILVNKEGRITFTNRATFEYCLIC